MVDFCYQIRVLIFTPAIATTWAVSTSFNACICVYWPNSVLRSGGQSTKIIKFSFLEIFVLSKKYPEICSYDSLQYKGTKYPNVDQ